MARDVKVLYAAFPSPKIQRIVEQTSIVYGARFEIHAFTERNRADSSLGLRPLWNGTSRERNRSRSFPTSQVVSDESLSLARPKHRDLQTSTDAHNQDCPRHTSNGFLSDLHYVPPQPNCRIQAGVPMSRTNGCLRNPIRS